MGRGRPKKVQEPTGTANEDTISIHITIPDADPNSNKVEGLNDETVGDPVTNGSEIEKKPSEVTDSSIRQSVDPLPLTNGSKTKKKPSEVTNSATRRSIRLVGKKGPSDAFNLVQCDKAATGPKASWLPAPTQEVSLEPNSSKTENSNDETIESLKAKIKGRGKQESVAQKKNELKGPNADTLPNSTEKDLEKEAPACTVPENLGKTVHLHFGPTEKKTAESVRRSSRDKNKTDSLATSKPVSPKKRASKRQKVIDSPSSNGTSSKDVPNVLQAVEERNLVTKDITGPDGRTTLVEGNYEILYQDAEKKIEELMAGNIQLTNQLNFERGKIEAYEKLMGVVMPLKCVSPSNAADGAPGTSEQPAISSPKGTKKSRKPTKGATVAPKAPPTVQKRKYKKK